MIESGHGKAKGALTFYTRGSCFVVFASLLTHVIVFYTTVLSADIVAWLLNAHSLLSVSFSYTHPCLCVCKMFILQRASSLWNEWQKLFYFYSCVFICAFQLGSFFIYCSHTPLFLAHIFSEGFFYLHFYIYVHVRNIIV